MKKIFQTLICIGVALSVVACSSTSNKANVGPSAEIGEQKLTAIMDAMNANNIKLAMIDGDPQDIVCFLDTLGEQGEAFGKYLEKAQRHVEKHWDVKGDFSDQTLVVTIEATVQKKGVISGSKVITSSGITRFDSLALEAFNQIPNLPKFPKNLSEDPLNLVFEYILEK